MALTSAYGKHVLALSRLSGSALRRQIILLLVFALPTAVRVMGADSATPGASNPNASRIVFSPSTLTLDNPAGTDWTISPAGSRNVVVNITVYDSNGNILTPTEANPLHVHVYGAPDGVITPVDSVITSGTTTSYTTLNFTYNGRAFPNSMELAAWMKDPSGGSESLGTTLFVHSNRPPCSYGSSDFKLDVTSTVPDEIQVKAVVGADNPQPADFKKFTIDTGSLGVIVTKSSLIMGANTHGPGAPGQKFYDSSGFVFTGNYYLAPVSVQLKDQSFVQTNPILVLAIDGVHCHSGYHKCVAPKRAELHYLGVGFDRNSTGIGDLFDSPSENAFLEVADAQNGTDVNQGYILSTNGVTLGITAANSSGFSKVTLDTNTTVPGDWNPVHGCYQFTSLSGSPQFCGNLLLDVGISEMFLDLSSDLRPAGSYDSNNMVPPGVEMKVQAGADDNPAMSYSFQAVQPPQQPQGPAPTYAKWIDNDNVFVNTGRRPLLEFDYLFSGQCGQVGYLKK